MSSVEARQQQLYDQMLAAGDGAFPAQRPAIFSPAAPAQDPANGSALYFRWTPLFLPYEFTGWREESRAHVESCYIGDWSGIGKLAVRGRDALAFLSSIGMNSLARFEIGQIKHHIQLTDEGRVASEGVIYRRGEEDLLYTGGGVEWAAWRSELGSWDAELDDVSARNFIFEVQGPTSLFTLEAATGEGLRDIRFNHGRAARIAGLPVQVLRTGISGELGYELHGSADHASAVWSAVVAAGHPFGLRQLGVRAQLVQHIETGIATVGVDYLPGSIGTPGAARLFPAGAPRGSFIPRNGISDYFRYPGELGWGARGNTASHAFVGRDALEALNRSGGPARRLVTLVWNGDDVRDLLAAQLAETGDLPEAMEMPRLVGGSYDSVLLGGREIGVSTSRTFSANLRKTISLCVIERDHAVAGTPVRVLWGSPGTAQREIRATVADTPVKPDRRRTDVSLLQAAPDAA